MEKETNRESAILEFQHITKRFPGVKALDDISLAVRKGTVHVLVGENGAGKSTLMKILDGIYHADEGKILLEGKEVEIKSSQQAKTLGIGMIHQELNIVGELSIAENIFLGKEPTGRLGLVDKKSLYRMADEFMREQELNFSPSMKMKEMSVGEQQMIEIIKTVFFQSKIIIMDEPTSSLSGEDVKKLFEKIRELKEKGTTIIYISHRLEEIEAIGDVLTVMRDGRVIETRPVRDWTRNSIITAMVGRSIENSYPKEACPVGGVMLEIKGMSNERVTDVSFYVRKGEILGFAGLVGAGRTEVARAVFGMDPVRQGELVLEGRQVVIKRPRDAVDLGIMMVSEDRRRYGLVTKLSIRENISLPNYGRFSSSPFVNRKKEKAEGVRMAELLSVKASSLEAPAASLSGGNQQKVVLAKWLLADPKVFILDEPTRGIDVGAKYEIYRIMCRLAAQGISIIMISSDLPELIGMADRIYVMHEGRIAGEVEGEKMTQENIMWLATGGREDGQRTQQGRGVEDGYKSK